MKFTAKEIASRPRQQAEQIPSLLQQASAPAIRDSVSSWEGFSKAANIWQLNKKEFVFIREIRGWLFSVILQEHSAANKCQYYSARKS